MIALSSPVVKLNVAANCLLLVTKDCILRLFSLEMIKSGVYADYNKGERENSGAVLLEEQMWPENEVMPLQS